MNLKTIQERVLIRKNEFTSWNLGKCYVSIIKEEKPELMAKIRHTNLNPINDDSNIPRLIRFLKNNLKT